MKLFLIFTTLSITLFCCESNSTPIDKESTENIVQKDSIRIEETKTPRTWEDTLLGDVSIKTLIDTGITVEPSIYNIKFETSRKFKNESIILSIQSIINKKGIGKIESLTFQWQGIKCEFKYLNLDFYTTQTLISVQNNADSQIKFDDFNFDGFPDLSVKNEEESGTKNQVYDIFIFSKEDNKFYKNTVLSKASNLTIDTNNQSLKDYWTGGMASNIYGSKTYKWIDNNLVVIHSVFQDYSRETNMFIYKSQDLVNGKLHLNQVDSIPESEMDN